MPSPPVVRGPAYEDIAGTTEALARHCSGWRPPAGGMDAGRALIRIFERMARHVIERLDRVPERSFLDYLNLIGVEPVPPRPARVPLTFTLVERGAAEPVIPAGTRVGAEPLPGDTREIVFETERELTTTRARLAAVIAMDTVGEAWADRTEMATGPWPELYAPFLGEHPLEHALYLSADDVLGLPPGTEVTLTLTFDALGDTDRWQALEVSWAYWNGFDWTAIIAAGAPSVDPDANTWSLRLQIPGDMAPVAVDGRRARWLRAKLDAWPSSGAIPSIIAARLRASLHRAGIAPDLALSSGRKIDLSTDFYPLGERPRINDTLHVASGEVLSRPGATVSVKVTQSAATPSKYTKHPVLAWEVSTAAGWQRVSTTDTHTSPGSAPHTDWIKCLFEATFTLPADVAPADVHGARAHWLRLRFIQGDFGSGVRVVTTEVGSVTTSEIIDDFQAPILDALTFDADYMVESGALGCLTLNDLTFIDQTGAGSFIPFQRAGDRRPALYLGFDRPFANRSTLLYLDVAPLSAEEAVLLDPSGGAPPKIVWEYATPSGWASLSAEDETRGFAWSGLVRFIGPPHLAPRTIAGRTLRWIRARLAEGSFQVMPRLGRVLTNTVWARHTATITGEVLGSSDGSADQVLTLAQRPVLEGQRIEVREPEVPPPEERAAIEALEGPDAIRIAGDPGRPQEVWVRWHEVPDFHASGPRDRHYRLDRATGEIRFGNGRRGMAPPRGARSVRAALYRTGGGADGDRPEGTVSQLKAGIPYVDGVTNRVPAAGGTDREALDRVKERGPRVLRHRGRAVTAEDVEDLAVEASPAVARARALPPFCDPIAFAEESRPDQIPGAGQITVLIVPANFDYPPTPSMGLLREVEAYLRRRCPAGASIRVTGPEWIAVGVRLTVVPVTMEGVDALRRRVTRALSVFLNPLGGGEDGQGWAFGRAPEASDIYRCSMSVAGVDSVHAVSLEMWPEMPPAHDARIDRCLIYPSRITVVIAPREEG